MPQRNRLNANVQTKIIEIRALDLKTALTHYGVQFGRNGFARCPFHDEKTPSFKVHANKFKCFGCGATGDLIDFVRRKQNAGIAAAVDMICQDFKIDARPTPGGLMRLDQMRMRNARSKKEYRALMVKWLDAHEAYLDAYDARERAAECGETPDDNTYVDAQFALIAAEEALERAECTMMEYAAQHPSALPIAPKAKTFTEKLEWTKAERRSPFMDCIRQDGTVRNTDV